MEVELIGSLSFGLAMDQYVCNQIYEKSFLRKDEFPSRDGNQDI
jgi:hypothetical protein